MKLALQACNCVQSMPFRLQPTALHLLQVTTGNCFGSCRHKAQACAQVGSMMMCCQVNNSMPRSPDNCTNERHCVVQTRILDFMAISMGIVAGVRPGATLLQPVKPPQTLCTLKNYVLICETALIACIIVFGCARLLLSQLWYTGGNGQSDHVGGFAAVLLHYTMHIVVLSLLQQLVSTGMSHRLGYSI